MKVRREEGERREREREGERGRWKVKRTDKEIRTLKVTTSPIHVAYPAVAMVTEFLLCTKEVAESRVLTIGSSAHWVREVVAGLKKGLYIERE